MAWETDHEKIGRLRIELETIRQELIDAEADLAEQKAELEAFEAEFDARLGPLLERLTAVTADLNWYQSQIKQVRFEQTFDHSYTPAEEQYRRTWQQATPDPVSPAPAPQPPPTATQAQLKKLYRRLARRYHPDLTSDETERAYRTQKMAAINDAYQAQSMVELLALARDMEAEPGQQNIFGPAPGQSTADMIGVLERELKRCRQRLRAIAGEQQTLRHSQMVELAIQAKLAQQGGRDYLAEMASELERKIGRKTAERDMIKSQLDNMP